MLTITFLADKASFLAGGGDMVLLLVPSAVVLLLLLLRAGGLTLAVFCSSARCKRSTLLAGDDKPLEPFLGVEGASPTGALFGQTESWIQREKEGKLAHCSDQLQRVTSNLNQKCLRHALPHTKHISERRRISSCEGWKTTQVVLHVFKENNCGKKNVMHFTLFNGNTRKLQLYYVEM